MIWADVEEWARLTADELRAEMVRVKGMMEGGIEVVPLVLVHLAQAEILATTLGVIARQAMGSRNRSERSRP